MMRGVGMFICLAMLCSFCLAGVNKKNHEESKQRVKRDGGGLLGFVLSVGPSVAKALKAFNELIEDNSAVILIELVNYTKWSLKKFEMKLFDGITNTRPKTILPGYKGAWTASHTQDHDGTEGYAAWTMGSDKTCMVYWRVEQRAFEHEPNALAMGCFPTENSISNMHTEITKASESADPRTEYMVYQVYDDEQPTIQFCDDEVCIQGGMVSSHHAEADVEVFPIKVTDLATNLPHDIDQKLLDDTIDEHNQNKLPGGGKREGLSKIRIAEIIGGTLGGLALIAIVMGLTYCWHKKKCCWRK